MNDTNADDKSDFSSQSDADYTVQAWRVAPGSSRTIDVTEVRELRIFGLMGGQA